MDRRLPRRRRHAGRDLPGTGSAGRLRGAGPGGSRPARPPRWRGIASRSRSSTPRWVDTDERVGIAWAEFPHLYEPFYTFQSTVGVAVALALVARIEAESEYGRTAAAEAHLEFLAAGGAVPPVELFARVGFDITSTEPVEAAFDVVEGLVARLEAHAERLSR